MHGNRYVLSTSKYLFYIAFICLENNILLHKTLAILLFINTSLLLFFFWQNYTDVIAIHKYFSLVVFTQNFVAINF